MLAGTARPRPGPAVDEGVDHRNRYIHRRIIIDNRTQQNCLVTISSSKVSHENPRIVADAVIMSDLIQVVLALPETL